ncbi:metal-dependent transcriptional regulator [Arthrobacter sp. Br18]|uniref:metal-dependent transcriptional regulator n=1 Tax=Arthrobacter sp. Br18 TaxID=1312954 RepID=UPI0004B06875|nr:metal-dependent transcriptional regulator [Arthrobacter sp. Br18]
MHSIDSSSVQDYVKTIYGFTEWQETPITASQLAVRLAVANSSVTGMVAKLVELGLARHEKYGPITLTPAGLALGLAMVRRHRLIETFLVDHLGYSWDEVHDEAELLEHSVSDTFIERLDRKLGHPVRDPHGDPIPTPNGLISRPDAVRLDSLDDGHRARVARISDDNPAVLKFLAGHAVGLDTPLLVSGRGPFGALLTVAVGDGPGSATLQLGGELVAALWVESLGTHEGCTVATV